jgi:hypothetical protein
MARSKARGLAVPVGLLLVAGGVGLAVVLLILGPRRSDTAVDELARAPMGCTTDLRFSSTGTFFVYEETVTRSGAAPECGGGPTSGNEFAFELRGPGGMVATSPDRSADYDTGDFTGESVAVFEITEPGAYEISVHGPDPGSLAAVGRDPGEIADNYRRGAVLAGVLGIGLGVTLLVLGCLGSRRAGRAEPDEPAPWPPAPPTLSGIELPSIAPEPVRPVSPWAPPPAPRGDEPPTGGA